MDAHKIGEKKTCIAQGRMYALKDKQGNNLSNFHAHGKMYALKDKQGNNLSNFHDIVNAVEALYTHLYSPQSSYATFIRSSEEEGTEVSSVTSISIDEVKWALQAMTRGKGAGGAGIAVDLIKDGRYTMLDKISVLYTQGLTT